MNAMAGTGKAVHAGRDKLSLVLDNVRRFFAAVLMFAEPDNRTTLTFRNRVGPMSRVRRL